MDTTPKQMTDLFAQLGLPCEPADIKAFIQRYRPLDDKLRLADAPIWNDSQAAFLKEKLKDDGDWAMLIDSLNAQLRSHPATDSLPQAEPDAQNEGEGNVTAARRYNAATQAYVDSHDVTADARAAAPRTLQEAQAMQAAEAEAAARAAGETA
jgi:Protein of unknown function (DUF2789)